MTILNLDQNQRDAFIVDTSINTANEPRYRITFFQQYIKGRWETYYLCNCKIKLHAFSLSKDGLNRVLELDSVVETWNKHDEIKTFRAHQPFTVKNESVITYGVFVSRDDMKFLKALVYYTTKVTNTWSTIDSHNETLNEIYNKFC